MLTLMNPRYLIFLPLALLLMIAVACGDDATATPSATATPVVVREVVEVTKVVTELVEVTKIVPVEVTKIVTEQITEQVEVTKIVPVEVTKIVTELVEVTKVVTEQVEVTKEVPVVQTVVVTPTPTPTPQPTPTSPPPPPKEELVIALSNFGNENLDPLFVAGDNRPYLSLIYDWPLGMTKDACCIDLSGFAETWTIAPDAHTMVFGVRQGVPFHNGEELEASDFIFAMDRLETDPDRISVDITNVTKNLESWEATGKYEVTFTFIDKAPIGYEGFISPRENASLVPVDQEHVEAVGKEAHNQSPIGTGPYKFASRQVGSNLKLESAGEHFAVGTPRFRLVTFNLVFEESTRIAMLKTGQADFADISRERAKGLVDEGFQGFNKPLSDILQLFFMLWRGTPEFPDQDTIFQDIRLREALSLAINREELVEFVLQGLGDVHGNFLTPAAIGYTPFEPGKYDPERAKQLLTEAGYGEGGETLTIKLEAFPKVGWPEALSIAGAIAGYFEAVGVKSDLTYRDYGGGYRPAWFGGTLPEPSVTIFPIPGIINPLSGYPLLLRCDGVAKFVCDSENLDPLVTAVQTASDVETFQAAASAVDKYVVENFVTIPIARAGPTFVGNDQVPTDFSPGNGAQGMNIRQIIWEE